MKYSLLFCLLLIGVSSCKKRNVDDGSEPTYHGIDALRNNDWIMSQQFSLANYTRPDTFDYMQGMDSCERNAVYNLRDSSNMGLGWYDWMYTNPCSGGQQQYSIFWLDTVGTEVYVNWGWYTLPFKLETLDQNKFSFYTSHLNGPEDSSRFYFVFLRKR